MTTREILEKAQLARWEWERRIGFRRYVLRFGLLRFGLPMFLLMTFFISPPPIFPLKYSHILISLVIWAATGWFVGWLTWRRSENEYYEANGHSSAADKTGPISLDV